MAKGKRIAPKKRMKTSTVVLLALGVFLLAFVITMIVIFCIFQAVPEALIEAVLDVSKIEAAVLAAIKIAKVIRGEQKERNLDGDSETEVI